MSLETANSLYGQEGQPLSLIAIKLSRVITNNDVTVAKVDLISNRMDTRGEIYKRSRRLVMPTFIAMQLVGLVVTGRCDGNWFREESETSVGPPFFSMMTTVTDRICYVSGY